MNRRSKRLCFCIEHVAQFCGELLDGEWLGQKMHIVVKDTIVNHSIFGEAGSEDHLQSGYALDRYFG